MTQPLISVIVPVYNVEPYINKCIDSILSQTYKNLEVILVDDGSPDNCPKICDDYASIDNRVKVIHQKNAGQSIARNNALDICTGEYIAFVDSDDWIEPDAYEKIMEIMQRQDLDIVFCMANIIKNDSVVGQRFKYLENETVLSPNELVELSLKDEIGGQPWLKVCNKNCWSGVRFPAGRIYEDLAISFYPFLKAKKPIGFLAVPLYNYRLNEKGTSLSLNPKKAYHIFLGFKEHYEYARLNLREAEECCLSKTVYFGLSAYGILLFESNDIFNVELEQIRNWFKNNKTEINKCRSISLVRKIPVLMLIYAKSLFKLLNLIYRKLKD